MAKSGLEPSAVQQLVKTSAKQWIGAAAGSETVKYSLLRRFEILVGRASSVTELSSAQELVECILTMFASSSELHGSERDASLAESMGRPKPSYVVLEELKNHRCPSGSVFKRKAIEDRVGNVPDDQVATLCDVAVVRLLCRCSNAAMDGSTYGALTWALDYVKQMLGSLIEGPLHRSRTGWYGIRLRERRSTAYSSPHGRAPPLVKSSTSPTILESAPAAASEPPVHYTIDVQREITTCITSEGRISLLAILSALSALPGKVLDLALLNRIRPIIQFCLDIGTTTSVGGAQERQQHSGRVSIEEAGRIYSREVVHGVLQVLAQCFSQSDCMFVELHDQPGIQGRSMTYGGDEGRRDKMRKLIISLKDKLLYQIFTIHGSDYRKWLLDYVCVQPIARVLSFLHCILSYCRTCQEVEEGTSSSKITFYATTAALSFRPLVDRLIHFDVSETAIQQSSTAKNILLESCQFVHYCQHLLQSKDAHVVRAVKQLHMHVQRVALSVVFVSNIDSGNPSHSGTQSPEPDTPTKEPAEPALDLGATLAKPQFAQLVTKVGLVSSGASSTHPAPPRRAPTPTSIWQVLPLGEIHARLQRLALLMDLSEPGTVPEPHLLASLLDFTKKAPVVVRAAVFMECAFFVRRLRSGARTPWVLANIDKTHDVLPNLKRWGEAVGFKLQEIQHKETQPSFTNAERTLDPPMEGAASFKTAPQKRTVEEPLEDVLNEEPVYPDHKSKGSNIAVSYALKAAACQLLQEITGILLDPPRVYQTLLAQKTHLEASSSTALGHSSADILESSQGLHRGGRAYRKGRRQSVAHSRAFDDVTRRSTLRNPKVNVVYTKDAAGSTESLRSSDNPNPAASIVLDTSPGPTLRQRKNTLSTLLAPTSAGNRISQNLSKLMSSFGLSGSFRHSTRRRSMVSSTTSPSLPSTSSIRRKSVMGEPVSSDHEAVHIPWLETVAQLLRPSALRVPEHEKDRTMCLKTRKKQCAKLTASLLKIYCYQPEPRRRALTPDSASHKKSKWEAASFSSKRSLLSQSPVGNNKQLQRPQCLSPEVALSAFQGKGSPLDELLEGTRTMQYSPCAGCSTLPVLLERDALLSSLEHEATFSTKMKVEEFGRSRRTYVKDHVATLFASIFITLMARVNDLSKLSLSEVQDAAWELLLDPDKELASLASAFFLLVCDKSSHKEMSKFFSSKMEGGGDAENRDTIARFTMLWSVRYRVLPKIPRDSQRKIRANELNLGYALPTPRLGAESAEIPLAPWQPVSICTGECKTDPKKCNHPTSLSPTLIHTEDILQRSERTFLSGISIAQKATSDSSKLVMVVDEHQSSIDSTERAWQFAVFPDSLLPLVLQVLSLASGVEEERSMLSQRLDRREESISSARKLDHMADVAFTALQQQRKNLLDAQFDPSTCKLSTSVAAKDTVFACLVEDHILFFQPFLHLLNLAYHEFGKRASKCKGSQRVSQPICQISIDEELDEALHGLRVVLLSFPSLPPDASRYLFNHLIGIVMQHSHHSYKESPKLITGVLDLLQMLPTSIQGLNSKQIKNSLKKESCYPTIMTTARIQGMSKVDVCFKKSEHSHAHRIPMTLSEDTSVQDIIDHTLRHLKVGMDKVDRFGLYVVPKECHQRKFVPDESTKLMRSLVLQDHFSARTETLLLDIEQEDLLTQNSFEREQLLMYKLAEASRVLLAKRLLLSAENSLEEFYFMRSELTELASFPRKALDNLYSSSAHSHSTSLADFKHLHCVDTMLKGNWLEFILALFRTMPIAYHWSSEIMLFLSVVSGSLLLHVEDITILRLSLAVILASIHKFPSGPRDECAHLVVSTMIHVYAVHGENELVCLGLQHLWSHLHAIETEEYQFLLEAVTASLTMLSVDGGEPTSQRSTFISAMLEQSMAQASQPQIAQAVFALNKTVTAVNPPVDHLGVEAMAGVSPVKTWNPIQLYKVFNLYVTVVTAGAEKQRGLQMLVFLDHIAPLMVQSLQQDKAYPQLGALVGGLRNLVRACEGVRSNTHLRAGATTANTAGESGKLFSRLHSLVARRSAGYDLSAASLQIHSTSTGGIDISEKQGPVPGDKKQQKQESSLSTTVCALDSLLSLATVISDALRTNMAATKSATQRLSRKESHGDTSQRIDSKSASTLCTIAVHLVKQNLFKKEDEAEVPILKGCGRFTSTCVPNFDWSDPSFPSVMTLYVGKVTRLFRKLALEPQFHQSMWQCLCSIFRGINLTLERNPSLAASWKDLIANLLDSVFNVNRITQASSVEDRETNNRRVDNAISFLKLMPREFSVAYTTLAKTLMVTTAKNGSNGRFTLYDLCQGKVCAASEVVKALVVRKVVNPLLLVLGALPDFTLDRTDVDFLVAMFLSIAKDITRGMPRRSYPVKSAFKSVFLGVKVVAVTCHNSMTAAHWQCFAQSITAMGSKDFTYCRKRNRPGPETYKDITLYYKEFLAFVEEFVLVHPTPLRLYLWPALAVVESGLYDEKAIYDEKVLRKQVTGFQELTSRHHLVPQDSNEDDEQLCDLDRSIEALQRIKDTYFEDRDHLSHQEMLEGFETELFGGLFDISEASEYVSPSNRKQSRSASISDYLTRKKREIFATLGSSLSKNDGDLSKITEEDEEEEDVDDTTPSRYSAVMGSRGRVFGGKRSPRLPLRGTENLSSDDEEESSADQRHQMRVRGSRARKRGVVMRRDMSYEADTEATSPVQYLPAHTGLVTVTAEVNRDSRVSASSETSLIEGSRKSSSVTGDGTSPGRRPSSSTEPPKLGPRKLSDTLLLPFSSTPPPAARWPSDSHLTPEKPRGPSPMLISQRANATALSPNEAVSRRPLSLVRSNAVVEESPATTPETHSYAITAEVAMIESPTSGQRRPLLPGDREREQRRRSGSSMSQQQGEEQRQQQQGEEQFSRALGLALQDLNKNPRV